MSTTQQPPSVIERIDVASHKLAIYFSDDAALPSRYRRLKDPSRTTRKVNEDSEIEKRFKATVESWTRLIHTMLDKIDHDLAWRFIDLSPRFVVGTSVTVSGNEDFSEFIDYLILRRDSEQCEPDELGGLAMLSVAFQKEIEKHIQE